MRHLRRRGLVAGCVTSDEVKEVLVRGRMLASTIVVIGVVVVNTADGATPPAQIRITDVQASYVRVPSANGRSAGSVEIIKQLLYNPSLSQSSIGNASLVCTYLDTRARTCTGTYALPKGNLVVAGAIASRLLYEIAVVGGTGLYDNARGTLTVTSTDLRPRRRELLLFRLAG
jgi:hypothetical protein